MNSRRARALRVLCSALFSFRLYIQDEIRIRIWQKADERERERDNYEGNDVDACVFLTRVRVEHPVSTTPPSLPSSHHRHLFQHCGKERSDMSPSSLRSFVPYKFTRSHALHPTSLSLGYTVAVLNGERTLR